MPAPAEARLGGPLGAAIDASRRGRLSTFVVDADSPAIALFAPAHRDANAEGDWYGEHAGKWLVAATRAAALAAASAPALAACQLPAASGVPLSMEYSPRRATKLSGSMSLRSVRTGQTEGKGCTWALAGSSANHCAHAVCRNCR